MLSDNVTSSSDVEPCRDVVVAGEAQLQHQLLQEVASRKAAERRADCLRQLLTELRSRKVRLRYFTLRVQKRYCAVLLCHVLFAINYGRRVYPCGEATVIIYACSFFKQLSPTSMNRYSRNF